MRLFLSFLKRSDTFLKFKPECQKAAHTCFSNTKTGQWPACSMAGSGSDFWDSWPSGFQRAWSVPVHQIHHPYIVQALSPRLRPTPLHGYCCPWYSHCGTDISSCFGLPWSWDVLCPTASPRLSSGTLTLRHGTRLQPLSMAPLILKLLLHLRLHLYKRPLLVSWSAKYQPLSVIPPSFQASPSWVICTLPSLAASRRYSFGTIWNTGSVCWCWGNTSRFTARKDAAFFLITRVPQPQLTSTVAPVDPRFCVSGAGLFFITASSSVPGDQNPTQILNSEYRQPQRILQGSLKLPSEILQPGPPLPALFSDVSFLFP